MTDNPMVFLRQSFLSGFHRFWINFGYWLDFMCAEYDENPQHQRFWERSKFLFWLKLSGGHQYSFGTCAYILDKQGVGESIVSTLLTLYYSHH